MTKENITQLIQTILIREFSVSKENFGWDIPLEALSEDFKFLSALVRFEQLLNQELNTSIQLIHSVSTIFHTPKDLVEIIYKAIDE